MSGRVGRKKRGMHMQQVGKMRVRDSKEKKRGEGKRGEKKKREKKRKDVRVHAVYFLQSSIYQCVKESV